MARALGVVLVTLLAVPAMATQLNPITRVVELMEGMVKKITKDGKAEEDLFEQYVCWYKTVVSTKKAAISTAGDRIESLSAYIDDVKSGRVEFTSERKDLEAEIAKLNSEIEEATAMRKKDNEDFLAAKDEMEKAIAALESAVEILGSTTEDMKTGVLLSTRFDLRRAVSLGSQMLSESDTKLLERALDGDVDPDWKKLNRKAVFKMKYKARSGKIQEILADMLQTFKDNLSDAEKKEAKDKSTSETLLDQKRSQLGAAQDALTSGDAEGGARASSIEESQEEVDSLTDQVKADEGYIQQAEEAYAVKITEWKERKRLRSEEIASIEKAIEILSSDEARDTMSSSFESQGNFLQEDESKPFSHKRVRQSASHLHKLAKKTNDLRLTALAVSIRYTTKGHFDEVVEGIDKMISDLHHENDMDLKVKEDCEEDRTKNTKMAKNAAYEIDGQTAIIVRKKAEIDAKTAEIERLTSEKESLKLQRDESVINRAKEAKEYAEDKATDEAAVALITKAADVLKKFFEDNGLAGLQVSARAKRAAQEVGQAPPPPPSTWSEPYGGAKGESNGVQSILSMIKADVEKDIKTATEAEEGAIRDHETFMSESKAMMDKIDGDVADLEGEIGDAEVAIKDARGERKAQKQVMEESLMYLRSIEEGCDFMAANFELRKANREAETDGLLEAEALLTGAAGGSFR